LKEKQKIVKRERERRACKNKKKSSNNTEKMYPATNTSETSEALGNIVRFPLIRHGYHKNDKTNKNKLHGL
jgi:hypothetical protein